MVGTISLTERLNAIKEAQNGEKAMEFARKWIMFPISVKTQKEITAELKTIDSASANNNCLGIIMKDTTESPVVKRYVTFKFQTETAFTKLVDQYCLILAEMMNVAVMKSLE